MTADSPMASVGSGASAGTLTFLFTDLEGSTRLWEQQPEAMQVALARHDELLHQAVEQHQGRVIKTTGDGIHAVFNTAADGVHACLVAQQLLAAQQWNGVGPLRVRMALHTGEAESRLNDYFGNSLNRAARLMSVAHGGQVLLSNAAAELARDALPPGVSLRDLGAHRLKDLIRPEHVFQLDHPSLPSEFPPLRSLDSFPNNLPVQLTSFIGRERELVEARQRLDSARLLTLIGPGGTGKTRLALQLAAEVLPSFSDGVWLAELAPLADPGLVLRTVASLFHLQELPGMPLSAVLADYLRAKHMLLIMDNCEHMVDSCAQLAAQILQACPDLKMIVSSREALGVYGEVVYRLPSLSLPNPDDTAPEALARSESVQLFLERARLSSQDFRLTGENAAAVCQICSRLDGIPLAIELAAARLSVLTVDQIAARLDDRFKLLTGGSRTALPRQQTLRALIDWSHEMLSEEERALFRRLSTFSGGWVLEAAESVCGGSDLLEVLAQLVNKSLVMVDDRPSGRRYRYLETIRQYARDKLFESGEAESLRDRHLAWFVQFAELAGPQLDSPYVLEWIPRLEAEYDNIRSALEWCMDRDPLSALRLVGSLAEAWFRRGHGAEGIRWAIEALARPLPEPDDENSRREQLLLRGRAYQSLAFLLYSQGDNPGVVKATNSCLSIARQAGDARMLALALTLSASSRLLLAQQDGALEDLQEAVAVARQSGDRFTLGLSLSVMSQAAIMILHDPQVAEDYEAESLSLLTSNHENWWATMMVRFGAGRGAIIRGDFPRARLHFAECLPAFEQMGDLHRITMIHSELAHMERLDGHYEEAAHGYRQTIRIWQKLGHRAAIAHQLECFAFIANAQMQGQRAARLFGAAQALRERIGIPMNFGERPEYEQQVGLLSTLLGKDEIASAWAEGSQMTLEQAIEYAIQ